MKVFVTGGNGFIGSAVVRELVARGHTPVCLLRKTSDTKRIDALPFERADGDVRDLASVRAGMAGCDGTAHLAAPGGWHADDAAGLEDVIVTEGQHYIFDAKMLLAEVNDILGTTIEDEDIDTIGGWFMTQHFDAVEGDSITAHGYEFKIKELDGHHILYLEVTKLPKATTEENIEE